MSHSGRFIRTWAFAIDAMAEERASVPARVWAEIEHWTDGHGGPLYGHRSEIAALRLDPF